MITSSLGWVQRNGGPSEEVDPEMWSGVRPV
jgi:hypothetical protein